jgi:hypothetical protein
MVNRIEMYRLGFILPLSVLLLSGCGQGLITPPVPVIALVQPSQEVIATALPVPSVTPTPFPNPTPVSTTAIFTPTAFPPLEPAGCKAPPEDYTIVHIDKWLLNQRTYVMLQYAAKLYQVKCGPEPCPIDITGSAITQGSYSDTEPGSFGTHAGGGAVDLSVISQTNPRYTILYNEIEPLIHALRVAGFAAWFRDLGEVYPGSPLHIHAVAIADKQLSQAARDQIDGRSGYLRGYSGLPAKNGTPQPDPHGGPIICQWMREAGYEALSQDGRNSWLIDPPTDWHMELSTISPTYLAPLAEGTPHD